MATRRLISRFLYQQVTATVRAPVTNRRTEERDAREEASLGDAEEDARYDVSGIAAWIVALAKRPA